MSGKNKVHKVFSDLIGNWAKGVSPGSQIEAISPALAKRLNSSVKDFSFDDYFHNGESKGWHWKTMDYPEVFKGSFFLYLPDDWNDLRQKQNSANVLEGQSIRQSMFILDKERWVESIPGFLDECEVDGFAYYPLLLPTYDQWVVCTVDAGKSTYWLYAIYGAGDWVFVTKSDAKTDAVLEKQLISLLNTNPWYGWIQSAEDEAKSSKKD